MKIPLDVTGPQFRRIVEDQGTPLLHGLFQDGAPVWINLVSDQISRNIGQIIEDLHRGVFILPHQHDDGQIVSNGIPHLIQVGMDKVKIHTFGADHLESHIHDLDQMALCLVLFHQGQIVIGKRRIAQQGREDVGVFLGEAAIRDAS